MTTQTKFFHSRRAAEREALKREQNSRTNFYFIRTTTTGQHYVAIYDTHMNHTGNV